MNENVVLNEQDILALPFVPLRGIVVYPKLVSHIDIGRDTSLAAVDYAMEHDRQLLVATQVDENEDNPGFDDVYTIGCLVKIEQLLRMPGGLVRILVNGISRVRMQGFSQKADYLEGAAVKVAEISRNEVEEEALRRVVLKRLLDWMGNLRDGEEASENAKNIDEPGVLADFAASQLPLRLVIRQQLLETAHKDEEDFENAMCDDFNTALASAAMFDLAKNVNIFKNAVVNNGVPVDSAAMSEVKRVFKTFTDILGILEDRWTGKKEDASSKDYDDLMQVILDIRQECRAQKQYALADAIRDKLAALGITIEDSPQGARWKK